METLVPVLAWIFSVSASAVIATWWLSRQFSSVRDLIHTKLAQTEKILLDKLEYHERHDDQRFSDILNQIWEMKMLQAAQNGMAIPVVAKKRKTTDNTF